MPFFTCKIEPYEFSFPPSLSTIKETVTESTFILGVLGGTGLNITVMKLNANKVAIFGGIKLLASKIADLVTLFYNSCSNFFAVAGTSTCSFVANHSLIFSVLGTALFVALFVGYATYYYAFSSQSVPAPETIS